MIQPVFLQAFANRPVQVAASAQATSATACASCGRTGCNCDSVRQPGNGQPVDELELSPEALAAADRSQASPTGPPAETTESASEEATSATESNTSETNDEHEQHVRGERTSDAEKATEAGSDLTEEEEQQVAELKSRDREVRAHEQAHLAAAGPYATGGPTFSYQKGPDGQRYAVGGEVGIDTSPVSGDPEATIQKAQQIRAAALAPASPSSQDQQVAAAATQMESQARAELSKQNQPKSSAATSYEDSNEDSVTGLLLDLVA